MRLLSPSLPELLLSAPLDLCGNVSCVGHSVPPARGTPHRRGECDDSGPSPALLASALALHPYPRPRRQPFRDPRGHGRDRPPAPDRSCLWLRWQPRLAPSRGTPPPRSAPSASAANRSGTGLWSAAPCE